jgi:shikimate dehydrogenase
LTIVDRTKTAAEKLSGLLSEKFGLPASAAPWDGDYEAPPDADLLIHAAGSSHAAKDTRVPLLLESLRPEMLVADATPYAADSWLLAQARRGGCKTVDGLTMFLERIAIALQLWTDIDPNRQVLREAAEEFLEL